MDQINVMDHRLIVEQETYAELMKKNSYFRGMKEVEKEMFMA